MQVVYEVNVKGVDERRLVGTQLQKLAEGEAGAASYFVLAPRLGHFICSILKNNFLRILGELS